MMKNIFNAIFVLAAVLLIVACDDISLDKRLTYVEPPQVSRAVLIEDYTGQYCVNCPRATEEIERLIEQYGDTTVIAVAIHSGPFGKNKGEPSPLFTEVGDMYFNTWGMSAQPVGLIDRLFNSFPFSYTDWAGGVNYEVSFEAPVSFMTDIDYDTKTREAAIEVQTIGLDAALVSGKLQVWLVEDSIDSFQLMPDGSREEHYNHMHVFRTSVNDPWGDEINVNHGQVAVKNYDLKLDPAWVPEHCSIVTFLYNNEGVKQVSKQKLIAK
jgi:hypothetical protein